MLLIPHLSSLFPGLFERGVPVIQRALYVHLEKVFVYWGRGDLVLSPLLLFVSGRTLWMKRETTFVVFFFRAMVFVPLEKLLQYRREAEYVSGSPRQKRWMNSWEDQRVDTDPVVDRWQKRCWTGPVCQVFLTDLLANGSFWVEGKRQGPCLQGCSKQEGQSLFPTNLIFINLTHQKSWSRDLGI